MKIIIEKNETLEDAENALYKAMTFQQNGEAHEKFEDPVTSEMYEKLQIKHQETLYEMMHEIYEILDMEHDDDY